jgi:hypothetical protein
MILERVMKGTFFFPIVASFFLLVSSFSSLWAKEKRVDPKKEELKIETQQSLLDKNENIPEKNFLANCLDKKCCLKKYPEDYQLLQSAKGCKERGCGPYVDIYGLVWQSKEGSMEFAAKFKSADNPKENLAEQENIVIPDFAWRPGFKIDAGYFFEEDNWDIRTLWTFYRGEFTLVKKHSNVETYPEDNGIVPLYFISDFKDLVNPSPRYSHGNGDLAIYFNSLDFELAKYVFVRRKLSVRLLFGIKGSWINQNYRVEYTDGNTLMGPRDFLTLIQSHINFENNFWGMGPRIGFESKCHLIWGFKLFANTSASSLISHFKVKRKQHDVRFDHLTSNYEILPFRLKDDFYTIKPNIQLHLGFEWSRCFRTSFFGATVGYEMQYFWGQNQIKRTFASKSPGLFYSNRGDLQLHGLTASLKYEF